MPQVAQGVGTSPVVADVDGDGKREVALAPFLGVPTIYRADGSVLRDLPGAFGSSGSGGDGDEATPEGGLARLADTNSRFYTAQGAFGDLDGDGRLEYSTGTLGAGIIFFALTTSGARLTFDHLLSAWDATTGAPKAAFPRVMEDWMFFTGPAIADITGDGRPELIATSGGYFVHAFDVTGAEPAGWPKLTGQWQTSTPSVGDLDGDGLLEVVQTTRLGDLHVWSTAGDACQPDQWRKFRHDEWNTGTYGTDTRRPARIMDLQGTRDGDLVHLGWTAPGDDGACGTAATYELRAAAAPIDRTSFAQATVVVLDPPAAAGTVESAAVGVPAGTRFVALRAVDEAGNAGPLAVLAIGDEPLPTTTTTTSSTTSTSTTTAPAPNACQPGVIDCDDGNACTLDGCDPAAGCRHTSIAATGPEGVRCAIDNVRALLGSPAAQCSGRCRCNLSPDLDRLVAPLGARLQVGRPAACRKSIRFVKSHTAALAARVRRLSARGCLASSGGPGQLLPAVADLADRATRLARSGYCAKRALAPAGLRRTALP